MTRNRGRAAPGLALLLTLALAAPVALLTARPAAAGGTLAWPHFLKVHVENRGDGTRVVVDAHYAGVRWTSQPGVAAGDHLLRIDAGGFVRSLDAQLAFRREALPRGAGLTVHVQAPGGPGSDSFRFGTESQPLTYEGASLAGRAGNLVTDVQPYVPTFTLPMDFEINVGAQCRPNQYLQVAPEWTNTVWRTPDGVGPGLYRVRLNPDFSVVSLDGRTTFSQVAAMPWDHGHQILGVLIVHSCDPAGDGADIVGFGRNGDGSLQHMTTWDQRPDGGYGWQPFNCGQHGVCSSEPRESFAAGNHIVQVRPAPPKASLDLAAARITGANGPLLSVAASRAGFPRAGAAGVAVLARHDQFADALAGIPLALAKGGPLLLSSSTGVESEVVRELQRVLRPGGTVWLLGGEAALGGAVETTLRHWNLVPRRLAGATRVETAVAIAGEIGPAAAALVVNAWNFPDALAAGAAAGAVPGGAHVLLTDAGGVPAATAARLAAGGYASRTVFGGRAAVGDATFAALGAGERVAGADRDATAAAAAARFWPRPGTVWVAAGDDFVSGITGGAMAAAGGGPLLLATGTPGAPLRSYLAGAGPAAAYVMGGLDEAAVTGLFTQPSR